MADNSLGVCREGHTDSCFMLSDFVKEHSNFVLNGHAKLAKVTFTLRRFADLVFSCLLDFRYSDGKRLSSSSIA